MITGHPHDIALGTGDSTQEASGVYVMPRALPVGVTQWVTCKVDAVDFFERFTEDHLAIGLRSERHPGGVGVAIGTVGDGEGYVCRGVVIEQFTDGRLFRDTCVEMDFRHPFWISVHATEDYVAFHVGDIGGVDGGGAMKVSGAGTDIWFAHTSSYTEGAKAAMPAFRHINDGWF